MEQGTVKQRLGASRIHFTGRSLRGMDENHRIILPAKWRDRSRREVVLYVGPTVARPSLTVLPADAVDRLYEKLDTLGLGDAERWDFIRHYASEIEATRCDGQGRMTLTREHIQHAGLDGEVLLVGMIARFEIWNPKTYEAFYRERRSTVEQTALRLGF